MFEEVYHALDADLTRLAEAQNQPADTFKIPDNPLFVMTGLHLDDHGETHVLDGNGIPSAGVS